MFGDGRLWKHCGEIVLVVHIFRWGSTLVSAHCWCTIRGKAVQLRMEIQQILSNRGTERQVNDIFAKASTELLAGGVTSHQDPQMLRKAQRPLQGLQ